MMLVSRLCQGPLGGRRETSTDDRNNRWHQQSLSYNETPWSFQGNSPHSCRKTQKIPLYPEHRACASPSAVRIFEIFDGLARRHLIDTHGHVVQTFPPELTELQAVLLALLG